jgi:hypothetical protein
MSGFAAFAALFVSAFGFRRLARIRKVGLSGREGGYMKKERPRRWLPLTVRSRRHHDGWL